MWLLDSDVSGKRKAEVSYLTSGINWHSEYVAVVDQKDQNLELAGWVSIDNRSGATYEDAKVKLIAGEVHRVEEVAPLRMGKGMAMEMAAAPPQFEEKAFFEYHLYTLLRPATIKDNEIKQVSLFPSTNVKVKKIYTYDGARYDKNIRVELEFKNAQTEGSGMPLPQGKIRVYKADMDKSLEFVGEDRINHTPKDERCGSSWAMLSTLWEKERRPILSRSAMMLPKNLIRLNCVIIRRKQLRWWWWSIFILTPIGR